MNLNFVSSSTFSRGQSLYAVPTIRDMWDKMKEVVWKVFQNDVLVVCGDGRMDSPGFSAKYCMYTMMEHYLMSLWILRWLTNGKQVVRPL